MVVYKITNSVNGKIYIGITTTAIGKRIACYKSSVKKDRPTSHRIVLAMKKHGFENFKFEIIFETENKQVLKEKEIEFISLYNSCDSKIGYNISPGGFLPSEENIKKLSKMNRGKKLTKEHKDKISKSLMGHSVSDKAIEAVTKTISQYSGWNKGTKGVMKPNNTSFTVGQIAPNKDRKRMVDEFGKIRYVRPI